MYFCLSLLIFSFWELLLTSLFLTSYPFTAVLSSLSKNVNDSSVLKFSSFPTLTLSAPSFFVLLTFLLESHSNGYSRFSIFENEVLYWVWGYEPLIPAARELRQEDGLSLGIQGCPDNIEWSYLKSRIRHQKLIPPAPPRMGAYWLRDFTVGWLDSDPNILV